MNGVIHLDTLYLIIKYPHKDVFNKWYEQIKNVEYRSLKEGIPSGDFVIKGGAASYKVSVWQHDARVFFTDQVDDIVGDGNGCGIWVQLGPKFLIHHMDNLHQGVYDFLLAVGVKGEYPIKINRLDLAIDLFGVSMQDQDIKLWQEGWVGRSKVSGLFFNSRTSALETINIGSRQSPIYLRIYDKVAQAIKEGDIEYWLDIWKGSNGAVTRIEWEIKPSKGNFQNDLVDFSLFNGLTLRKLLNYLLDWGRLCIPNPDDSNNRRWKDTPLWERLRAFIKEYSEGIDWPISRFGKVFHGMSESYINFLSGTISGGMARFGLNDPDLFKLIEGLGKTGHGLEAMKKVAVNKAEIYKRL